MEWVAMQRKLIVLLKRWLQMCTHIWSYHNVLMYNQTYLTYRKGLRTFFDIKHRFVR